MSEIEVTQADRDFAVEIWYDTFGQQIMSPHDGLAAALLEEIAHRAVRHRHLGRQEGREEAARVAERCTLQAVLTPGFADGVSSGARQIVAAIRARNTTDTAPLMGEGK